MCLGIPGQIVEISDVAQQLATVELEEVRRDGVRGADRPRGPGQCTRGGLGAGARRLRHGEDRRSEAKQTLDELAR